MKAVFVIACLLAMAVVPARALAQGQPRRPVPGRPAPQPVIPEGAIELSLSGSWQGTSVQGETRSSAVVQALVGYFITSKIEAGGNFTAFKSEGLETTGAISGVALYNFQLEDSRLVPFVGGNVGHGYGFSAFTGNPWIYGLSGGTRLMTPRGGGALVLQGFYRRQSYPTTVDVNSFGLSFGVSLFF